MKQQTIYVSECNNISCLQTLPLNINSACLTILGEQAVWAVSEEWLIQQLSCRQRNKIYDRIMLMDNVT